jgi:hypothetical protein
VASVSLLDVENQDEAKLKKVSEEEVLKLARETGNRYGIGKSQVYIGLVMRMKTVDYHSYSGKVTVLLLGDNYRTRKTDL